MLSNWELWACARKLIEVHGKDAALRAAERADALLAEGDIDGERHWLAILRRINELEAPAGSASLN